MKKYVWLVMLIFLLMVGAAFAEEAYKYSGAKTADAAIAIGPGVFKSMLITADGTNSCKVVLYDNTSAAAPVLAQYTVAAGEYTGGMVLPAVHFNTALYADMTTSGTCTFEVYGNW